MQMLFVLSYKSAMIDVEAAHYVVDESIAALLLLSLCKEKADLSCRSAMTDAESARRGMLMTAKPSSLKL